MLTFFFATSNAQIDVAGLKVSGYIDAYYQTKFSDNSSAVANRSFYTDAESFALGNANLTIAKEFGKVGGLMQLGFGSKAEAANGGTNAVIQQLYAYYKATDKLTLTMGTFGTFVGYEVIDAPANFHYSTSNLFQNGPFYHTGLKADMDLGGGFSVMLGVFNDTDSQGSASETARSLHLGGQLGYSVDNFNLFANVITGKDGEAGEQETQVDLVVDKTAGDFYFALNAGNYFYDSSNWFGVAGYIQNSLSEKLAIGGRVEYFGDADGLTGVIGGVADGNSWNFTLSAPYKIDGLTITPEIRYDLASEDIYTLGDEVSNGQITAGFAANYSF